MGRRHDRPTHERLCLAAGRVLLRVPLRVSPRSLHRKRQDDRQGNAEGHSRPSDLLTAGVRSCRFAVAGAGRGGRVGQAILRHRAVNARLTLWNRTTTWSSPTATSRPKQDLTPRRFATGRLQLPMTGRSWPGSLSCLTSSNNRTWSSPQPDGRELRPQVRIRGSAKRSSQTTERSVPRSWLEPLRRTRSGDSRRSSQPSASSAVRWP